jgi:hypothetical protein
MKINLTISVDDCCPKKGYRLIGEPAEKWFRQLNEEFGCRFTLFCPSNFHGQYPISEHLSWAKELNDLDFCEIAFHGSLHQTPDPSKYGECEFGYLTDEVEISQRLRDMYYEWNSVGINPVGFRTPGWVLSDNSNKVIKRFVYDNQQIEYVAVHYEHNRNLQWDCKTFFGHDGIQQEHIEIHNISPGGETGMIMFQSHIAGRHNHNVWNEENYKKCPSRCTAVWKSRS